MQPSQTELEQYSNTDIEYSVEQKCTQTSDLSIEEDSDNFEKPCQFRRPIPKIYEEDTGTRDRQVLSISNTNLIIGKKSFPLIKSVENIKLNDFKDCIKIGNSDLKDLSYYPKSDEVSVEDTLNVIESSSHDNETHIEVSSHRSKEYFLKQKSTNDTEIVTTPTPKSSALNIIANTDLKYEENSFKPSNSKKIPCGCKLKSNSKSSRPTTCCSIGTSPIQSLQNTPIYVCTCLNKEERDLQQKTIDSCSKTLFTVKLAMDEFLSKIHDLTKNVLPKRKKSENDLENYKLPSKKASNQSNDKSLEENHISDEVVKQESVKSIDYVAKEVMYDVFNKTKPIVEQLTEKLSSTMSDIKEHIENKRAEMRKIRGEPDEDDPIAEFFSKVDSSVISLKTQLSETVNRINTQINEVPSASPYVTNFLKTVDEAITSVKNHMSSDDDDDDDEDGTGEKEYRKSSRLKDLFKVSDKSSPYDKPTPPKNVSHGLNFERDTSSNVFMSIKSKIQSLFRGTEPVKEESSSNISNMLKEPSEDEDDTDEIDEDD